MKKLALGVIVGSIGLFGTLFIPSINSLLIAPAQSEIKLAQSQTPGKKQNIVVHLNHGTDNLHAAFMALKLARGIQKKGNVQVVLLLTLEGVRIVDKQQPLNLRWGNDPMTLQQLYDEFIAAGGKVRACPLCSAAAGITAKDLRSGAQMAEGNQSIPDLILVADKVVDF
jgi:sulfur relay (sulfurtransferase) complex TusBCD TusD component (DsrE family)